MITLKPKLMKVRNKNGTFEDFSAIMVEEIKVETGNGGETVVKDESIDSYVIAEAERVAEAVQSRQGANTFTIMACSDLHFSYELSNTDQQKESLLHMGQAMELIRKAVNVDLAVMLGDIFYDAGESIDNALKGARYVNSCLYGGLADVPRLRARGNHDCLYSNSTKLTDKQIFANIGIFNKGAVYDSAKRLGGYCYRDFEDLKLRVVCINTCEISTGGFNVSAEQNTWLQSALDLTSKGEGWKSILISHHPLDWNNKNSNVMNTINSASGIFCTIHGHVHGFLVDKITDTSIVRMATPNACFGRENEYGRNGTTENYDGTEFGETKTYTKTANTCNDTAFVVYTIDFDEMKVYADNYGAGYGRVIALDGAEIPSYTITRDLTNVSCLNNIITSLQEGASLGDVLNGDSGYKVGSVAVTMGGVDVTEECYYNRKISIPSITGDVVINAIGEEGTDSPSEGDTPSVTPGVYTNLVPTSIGVDGDIFNEVGYMNGAYASDVHYGSDEQCVTTGYINFKDGVKSIYIEGAEWQEIDHCRIRFFTRDNLGTVSVSYTIKGGQTSGNYALSSYFVFETLGDKYYKLTVLDSMKTYLYEKLYCISLVGTGENLIITHDEPIK